MTLGTETLDNESVDVGGQQDLPLGNDAPSTDNQDTMPDDFQVGDDVRTFLYQNKFTDAETLKKSVMMAKDYTQKTQGLSARAKQLADEQMAPYQPILKLIDEDDEVFDYIKGKLSPAEIKEKVAEEKVTGVENPELKALRDKVAMMESRFKKEDDTRAYNEAKISLQKELDESAKTYTLASRAEVLAQIVAYPDAKIEDLMKANHEAKLKFKDSIIKDYVKSKGLDVEGAGVGGIGGIPPKGGVEGEVGKEPKSFAEADARARARLIKMQNTKE